jgi:zinc protease
MLVGMFMGRPAAALAPVQEVVSAKGVRAWLIEDHKLPVIALSFAFRGGVEQDPADRQGLGVLTMAMLTQGAGAYDERAFQQQLFDNALGLRFSAGRDAVGGGLKTLGETKAKGFELLRLALTQPRFDADSLARAKDRQIAQQKATESTPEWQARYALFRAAFGDHPYAYRSLGTAESVGAIDPAALRAYARQHFARDNLVVAVAGAISAKELRGVLDRVFGALPAKAQLAALPPMPWPQAAGEHRVPRAGTQVQVLFAVPSLKREDPAWYAAEVANYILGGGGFASRLMSKVREDEGLTYGIRTTLAPMDLGGLVIGGFATENAKAERALELTRAVWDDLVARGPTDDEVESAKAYLAGSMPLALSSTDAIAGRLVGLQLDHQPIDSLEAYESQIERVTSDQVRDALRRFFDPAKAQTVLVGGETTL